MPPPGSQGSIQTARSHRLSAASLSASCRGRTVRGPPWLVYTLDGEDGRASCGSLGDPSDKNRGISPSASARVICSDAPRFVRMRVSEVCRAGSLSQFAAHVTWQDDGHFNTFFNEGKKKKKKSICLTKICELSHVSLMPF